MTRVLMITSSFARHAGDPLAAHGNSVYELAAELGRHIEGTLLTPAQKEAPGEERLGGILVRRIPPERPVAALHKAIVGPDAVRVLRVGRSLRREARALAGAHDLVHGFWVYPGGSIAAGLDLPRIVTFPGPDVHVYPKIPVLGAFVRRVVRAADLCVAVDPQGREILNTLDAARVEHVPSVIRLDGFPATQPPRAPVVLYVGRLAKEKGVDLLVEAAARARGEMPELRLRIAGDGPERAAVERRIRALGLEQTVTLLGPIGQDEVARELAACRATVLASRREGLPAAALESLAAGRPVVAPRVGGLPELIGKIYGVLVPPEDAAALAGGMVSAVRRDWDPAVLHERTEDFGVAGAATRYVQLYRDVLKAKRESA